MNSYGQSGFMSSSEMNAKFEFSTQSTSKLDPEKPTFSSISSLSRPRMVKSRKSLNPRSMGSSGTRKIDSGFNPFCPVSDDDDGGGGGGDDNAVINSVKNLNLNLNVTSKVDKAGNALIDEIRKLRLENQNIGSQSRSNDVSGFQQSSKGVVNNDLPSELPDMVNKLNLGGSGCVEGSRVSGVAFGNAGGSHGAHNASSLIGRSLTPELYSGLERLNIKDNAKVGSENFVFGTPSRNSSVFEGNRARQDSNNPSRASAVPDRKNDTNIAVPGRSSGTQKDMNAKKNNLTRPSSDGSRGKTGGGVDAMILDDIGKLKIRDDSKESSKRADTSDSSARRNVPNVSMRKEGSSTFYPTESLDPIRGQGGQSIGARVTERQSDKNSGFHNVSASSTTPFSPSGLHFEPVRHTFEVPGTDGYQKKKGFLFGSTPEGSSIPHVEFKTPDSKGNSFSGTKLQSGFNTRKGLSKDSKSKGRKAQVKEPKTVPISLWKNSTPKENIIQDEASEHYSPMDVSPYRETGVDEPSVTEPSLASQTSIDSQATLSDNVMDDDLIRATERMDINEGDDVKHDQAEVLASKCTNNTCGAMGSSPVDCASAVESECFVSACENLDENGEFKVESNSDERSSGQSRFFSASSSAGSGDSSFAFAASSSSQSHVSAAMRQNKKKNRAKVGPDIYIPSHSAVLSDTASSLQFSPISKVSMLPSQAVQSDNMPIAPLNGGKKLTSPNTMAVRDNIMGDAKRISSSPIPPARAAQEACEKWRLRGNHAYENGDLEKAEDYYSRGLRCIPQQEISRDSLRALVLCYSNRAAARMTRGRMREALQDCLVAAKIDPNFFRVQLRAANCYLALGEIGDAILYFKKLLQSTDICVERKIILNASDGLQKAQKVSDFMDRAADFMLQRTFADAENALGVISEALAISPYSDKLLESKAEALLMLRRYEEVIQLCAETLEAAEKNSPSPVDDGQSSYMEASEFLKRYSFRIWRCCLSFKSNFYLGKLEEAIDYLEKQDCWSSMVAKFGKDFLESYIPQLSTARELINHKSAGNGAFQAGKHKEAVEHYTAALSYNVESRPFSAVCFANRAAAYQALGKITDAIADCSLAIALDENYVKAISRRATLFEMIRDYEQAAKDLERLVSLLTKQAEEKSNHAGAYLPMGSVADLRQARQRLYQMEEQAKKGIPLNFYLILGVEPSVTAAELKKAYRKAALRHHPDKAGQSLAKAESGDDGLWKEISEGLYIDADKLFKMIGEAYAVLSDPDKRSQYDIEEETRNGQRQSSSNASRMHTDNAAERSGVGRQWREMWRASANPYSRGFEPSRTSRYY